MALSKPLSGIVNSLHNSLRVLFSGKRALVTGAAGFIGSRLVRELLARGCSVIAAVRPQGGQERLRDLNGDLEILPLDLNTFTADDLARQKPTVDLIFHLGAYGVDPGSNDPDVMIGTNFRGTYELLKFARSSSVGRFIHCGSCFEYPSGQMIKEDVMPEPVSEYGASKAAAWMFVNQFYRQHHLPVITLRPFTVYGPGESPRRLVSSVIQAILKQEPLELTAGEQARDFVFVDDVVNAFLLAAGADKILEGETFNVSTGIETSVKAVVLKIIDLMGADVKPSFGAVPYRPSEFWHLSGDPSKAAAQLRWQAGTSLEEGLRQTIEWHSSRQKVLKSNEYGGA